MSNYCTKSKVSFKFFKRQKKTEEREIKNRCIGIKCATANVEVAVARARGTGGTEAPFK